MFDARSILDILLRGAGPPQRQGQPADPAVFRDLLGRLGTQGGAPGKQPMPDMGPQQVPGARWAEPGDPHVRTGQPAPMGGGSLEDLLRTILAGGQPPGRPMAPGGQMGPAGGNLQDLLRELLGGGPGGGPRPELSRLIAEQPKGGESPLLDALKQVLGQATSGVREGAARIDEATGASGQARAAVGEATGQSPDELMAQLKQLITANQLAAGAALGGLGALVLGTGAGRSLAAGAIKLGGLALIGGLAYKAYQNFQQGKPILPGSKPAGPQALLAAPDGSGFEAGAVSDEAAKRYIRTMIAAAAASPSISTPTRSTSSWHRSPRRWASTTASPPRSMPRRVLRGGVRLM